MSLFSFLKKKIEYPIPKIKVDIHSHLIFDVDDGSNTIEESITLIENFAKIGYQKIITTPHIMGDFYKNSKENLFPKRDIICNELAKKNINIQFECAAEHYLDEFFIDKIKKNEEILTLGDGYVLFETSFMNKPKQMHEVIFGLLSNGYKPVLAHPERYLYLHPDFEEYLKLKEQGVLFQLNINSLTGYYSKPIKKIAEKLIDNNLVDFIGSDCHNSKHFNVLTNSRNEQYYNKLSTQKLLNNSLL